MTIGALLMALMPVVAAVPHDAGATAEVPVAMTEPAGRLVPMLGTSTAPVLSDPAFILVVGSGLLGLAAIVRKSTRVEPDSRFGQ